MRKNKAMKEMEPIIIERFGRNDGENIIRKAWSGFSQLCAAGKDEPKEVEAITFKDIYPCIAIYRSLLESGVEKDEAVTFLDESWSRRAEKGAAQLRSAMKIPGLYRLYPAMFRKVAKSQFGEKAGFKAEYYDTGADRVKFDMTECLYCDVCSRNGCSELVPCFCHTDDVNNGNLHPKLCWNRTKIMGDGGDVCDFDLFIKKE